MQPVTKYYPQGTVYVKLGDDLRMRVLVRFNRRFRRKFLLKRVCEDANLKELR